MACITYRSSGAHCTSGFSSAVVSPGEHSVSPYAEKHLNRKLCSTSRIRDGEDAAPPIRHHCTLPRWYLERADEFTSTVAIIGTRLSALTFSRSTNRNTSSGTKRGSMTWVPPTNVIVCATPQPLA